MANELAEISARSTLDQRLKKCWRERSIYGDDGRFDIVIDGVDVDRLEPNERLEVRRSLEILLAPMKPSEIAGQLKRASLEMASKNEDRSDFQAKLLAYVADLANCSAFGIVTAMAHIRTTATFFPVVAEILREVERIERPYRIALDGLKAEPKPKQIAAPHRPRHVSKVMQAMIEDGLMNEDLSLTDKGRERAKEVVA